MKQQFSNYYEKDGEKYDRISSISSHIDDSGGLIQWAAKCGFEAYANGQDSGYHATQKVKEETANIGSSFHHVVSHFLKNDLDESKLAKQIKTIFDPFKEWLSTIDLQPILIEENVFSRRYKCAGTLDLYANVDGAPTLIDWKTGSDFYISHLLQLAGYDLCLDKLVKQYIIGNFSREGKKQILVINDPKVILELKGIFVETLANFKQKKNLREIMKELKKTMRKKEKLCQSQNLQSKK